MSTPADPVATATTAHWFVCAVCGERGGCDGQDEDGRGDDGEHVHFRQECWEVGPTNGHQPESAGGTSKTATA